MLIMADYHHTKEQAVWPSVPELAKLSLMSERNTYRLLSSLEHKGHVERVANRGRKNSYRICGLDTPEKLSPLQTYGSGTPDTSCHVTPDSTPDKTPDTTGSVIRKEPVFEPVLERGEEIPADLHPLNYASRIAQEIGLPETPHNVRAIAYAVEALARTKSLPAAYEYLLARAKDSQDDGVKVDKFYFEDRGYEPNAGRQARPSAAQQKQERAREIFRDAIRDRVGSDVGPGGGDDRPRNDESGKQPVARRTLTRGAGSN